MRIKIIITSFLLLFGMTSAFAQEWPKFKSTEENFTISLPSEPKQERTSGRSPLGNGHHIYSLDNNGVSFTISYSVFDTPPAQTKDIKRILDFPRGLVVMVTNGKQVADTDISIDGFPGRLVRIEKDKMLWTLRAYLVKERMYQLMTTEPKSNEISRSQNSLNRLSSCAHPNNGDMSNSVQSEIEPLKGQLRLHKESAAANKIAHYNAVAPLLVQHRNFGLLSVLLLALLAGSLLAELQVVFGSGVKIVQALFATTSLGLAVAHLFLRPNEKAAEHQRSASAFADLERRIEATLASPPSSRSALLTINQNYLLEMTTLARLAPHVSGLPAPVILWPVR